MLCSFSSNQIRQRAEQATWFLAARGFVEALAQQQQQQQQQQPKNLPNARFKVSGKLQLSQLSTSRKRHSSLIWPFAKMETVKRMVPSELSLADTCMSPLSSVLVIDINWIAAQIPHQLATPARHWTMANLCSFMAKVVWCSTLSDSELEQSTRLLVAVSNSSIRNQRIFPTQGLRCLENSSFLSFQHCEGHTLHWSDP